MKKLDDFIGSLLKTHITDKETRVSFAFGYTSGALSAVDIKAYTPASMTISPLIDEYTNTEAQKQSYCLGFLMGTMDVYLQLSERLRRHDSQDSDDLEETANDFHDALKRHNIKPLYPDTKRDEDLDRDAA